MKTVFIMMEKNISLQSTRIILGLYYLQEPSVAGPDMGNMGGGASQGGNEAGYGDDVVDADYKEV